VRVQVLVCPQYCSDSLNGCIAAIDAQREDTNHAEIIVKSLCKRSDADNHMLQQLKAAENDFPPRDDRSSAGKNRLAAFRMLFNTLELMGDSDILWHYGVAAQSIQYINSFRAALRRFNDQWHELKVNVNRAIYNGASQGRDFNNSKNTILLRDLTFARKTGSVDWLEVPATTLAQSIDQFGTVTVTRNTDQNAGECIPPSTAITGADRAIRSPVPPTRSVKAGLHAEPEQA